MNKDLIFRGVATALITPFKNDIIDFEALGKLIEFQIERDIDALVVAGTTGEAPTLSEAERERLFDFCIGAADGRVPIICGCGTNDTKMASARTKAAKKLGADAALIVTPYYNKGTEEGLLYHYLSIAENTDLPIILYNVPGRTGVNLSISLIDKLAESERIVAIKEASDSIDRLTALSALCNKIALYSGNDSQVYATMALGGSGVISVASNIIPEKMKIITDGGERGLIMQRRLLPFINALFAQTNPAPIKYAMNKLGFCEVDMRLPLAPPNSKTASLIDRELYELGFDTK